MKRRQFLAGMLASVAAAPMAKTVYVKTGLHTIKGAPVYLDEWRGASTKINYIRFSEVRTYQILLEPPVRFFRTDAD